MSAVAVLDHAVEAGPTDAGSDPRADHDRIGVVRVDGEFDAAIVGQFHAAIAKAVAAAVFSPRRIVVVDLAATRFLSIGAARALVAARELAATAAVEIRVVTNRYEVERVLDVTGARLLFPRCSTVYEAVRS
jgi:anti-sigma B factor antagonist